MAVDRELPTAEAAALLELTRDLAGAELRPRADDFERRAEFPREVFRKLGAAGLLGLPYPERYGGGGQPYTVYLQVLEELAAAWLTVGLGVSVHPGLLPDRRVRRRPAAGGSAGRAGRR